MTKRKVLFALQLPPPTYGATIVGDEIFHSRLINSTFNARFLNITLTRDLSKPSSALSRLFIYLFAYFRLVFLLLSNRFDLCYLAITCHGVGFLKDSLFVITCKLFCKRIVLHQHNKGMKLDSQKALYRFLYRLVYNNSKVILLSNLLYDDVSDHVKPEQVLLCPNGAPWLINPQAPPIHKPFPHRIIFLSNLFKDKGYLTFLDCCALLKEKKVSFFADMIGSETTDCNKEQLQDEIRRRNLTDNVVYHGRLTGKERDQIFSKGTYFLFPTKNEAFPLVLLEAIQFCALCLTTPVGGIESIISNEKTGFIRPSEDAEGFSQIIIQMESDNILRNKIVQNAFLLFQNKYTLDCFEKRMVSCLVEAME